MAITFSNGFAIGTTPGSGISPYWVNSVSGYTELTGGVNAADDGYFVNPIVLPYLFFQDGNSSTDLYVDTNGHLSLGYGYGNCCPNTPQVNNSLFGGNVYDNYLSPGQTSLSDGDTMGAWYKITDYGVGVFKVEVKVFQSNLDSMSFPISYQLNLYRDAQYQYMETWVKINNAGATGNSTAHSGPYNATDVTIAASKTRNTWRSDLNGQNWENLGNVNVTLQLPLTQYSNNGTTSNQGLILSLDGSVATSGTTILDQSGNGNHLTYSGSDPFVSSFYYDFNSGGYATLANNSMFNNLVNTMTMTMWVNFPTIYAGYSIVSRTSGNSDGWALRASSGQFNFVKYNIADQYSNGSFSYTTNTWYHIGLVQGGTSLMFTLNGVIVGSVLSDSSNFGGNNHPFYLCRDEYIGQIIPVKFGKLKIYDTFKTASDILTEFNTDKTYYGY